MMAASSRRIDPGLLATFLAVADAEKVSAAADVLHLSQPAVTAQIRKLEESIQAPLFIRSAHGVTLTPRGRTLYEYAREIEGILRRAESAVAEAREPEGRLRIAASTTIASYVMPAMIAEFCARHPKIGVEMISANTDEVLRMVREGRCPMGIVEGYARAPHLRLRAFLNDELVLVRSADTAYRARAKRFGAVRSVADLASVALIWREPGSGTRAVIERALRGAGVEPRRLAHGIVMGATEAIKAAVRAGLGVAFVSRWAIQTELELGTLAILPLADLRITRTLHWVFPTGALEEPYAEFIRFAESSPPTLAFA